MRKPLVWLLAFWLMLTAAPVALADGGASASLLASDADTSPIAPAADPYPAANAAPNDPAIPAAPSDSAADGDTLARAFLRTLNQIAILRDEQALKKQPDDASETNATLPKGAEVTVRAIDGSWCHVLSDTQDGYLPTTSLRFTDRPAGTSALVPNEIPASADETAPLPEPAAAPDEASPALEPAAAPDEASPVPKPVAAPDEASPAPEPVAAPDEASPAPEPVAAPEAR